MAKQNEWWKKFFGKYYLTLWEMPELLNQRLTNQQINFIIRTLKPKKKDKILDLCCGQGRHSIALAGRDFHVIGCDQSNYLLKTAKERAKKAKVEVKFIKSDARSLKLKEKFDIILNLYTSFGYASDTENEKIIKNVSKHLKKRGRFLLDMANTVAILRNYQAKKTWQSKVGKIVTRNSFNPKDFVNTTQYSLMIKGLGKKAIKSHVRLYTYPEIEKMLEKHGLRVLSVYGGFKGEKFTNDSRRMVIIAEKV